MTISQEPPTFNIKAVTIKIWIHKKPKIIHITSRTVARTIVTLAWVKNKGVTALEVSNWAFRLGAYVHILKRDYALDIQTLRENHKHGWHGRYVLHTPVEIIEIEYD